MPAVGILKKTFLGGARPGPPPPPPPASVPAPPPPPVPASLSKKGRPVEAPSKPLRSVATTSAVAASDASKQAEEVGTRPPRDVRFNDDEDPTTEDSYDFKDIDLASEIFNFRIPPPRPKPPRKNLPPLTVAENGSGATEQVAVVAATLPTIDDVTEPSVTVAESSSAIRDEECAATDTEEEIGAVDNDDDATQRDENRPTALEAKLKGEAGQNLAKFLLDHEGRELSMDDVEHLEHLLNETEREELVAEMNGGSGSGLHDGGQVDEELEEEDDENPRRSAVRFGQTEVRDLHGVLLGFDDDAFQKESSDDEDLDNLQLGNGRAPHFADVAFFRDGQSSGRPLPDDFYEPVGQPDMRHLKPDLSGYVPPVPSANVGDPFAWRRRGKRRFDCYSYEPIEERCKLASIDKILDGCQEVEDMIVRRDLSPPGTLVRKYGSAERPRKRKVLPVPPSSYDLRPPPPVPPKMRMPSPLPPIPTEEGEVVNEPHHDNSSQKVYVASFADERDEKPVVEVLDESMDTSDLDVLAAIESEIIAVDAKPDVVVGATIERDHVSVVRSPLLTSQAIQDAEDDQEIVASEAHLFRTGDDVETATCTSSDHAGAEQQQLEEVVMVKTTAQMQRVSSQDAAELADRERRSRKEMYERIRSRPPRPPPPLLGIEPFSEIEVLPFPVFDLTPPLRPQRRKRVSSSADPLTTFAGDIEADQNPAGHHQLSTDYPPPIKTPRANKPKRSSSFHTAEDIRRRIDIQAQHFLRTPRRKDRMSSTYSVSSPSASSTLTYGSLRRPRPPMTPVYSHVNKDFVRTRDASQQTGMDDPETETTVAVTGEDDNESLPPALPPKLLGEFRSNEMLDLIMETSPQVINQFTFLEEESSVPEEFNKLKSPDTLESTEPAQEPKNASNSNLSNLPLSSSVATSTTDTLSRANRPLPPPPAPPRHRGGNSKSLQHGFPANTPIVFCGILPKGVGGVDDAGNRNGSEVPEMRVLRLCVSHLEASSIRVGQIETDHLIARLIQQQQSSQPPSTQEPPEPSDGHDRPPESGNYLEGSGGSHGDDNTGGESGNNDPPSHQDDANNEEPLTNVDNDDNNNYEMNEWPSDDNGRQHLPDDTDSPLNHLPEDDQQQYHHHDSREDAITPVALISKPVHQAELVTNASPTYTTSPPHRDFIDIIPQNVSSDACDSLSNIPLNNSSRVNRPELFAHDFISTVLKNSPNDDRQELFVEHSPPVATTTTTAKTTSGRPKQSDPMLAYLDERFDARHATSGRSSSPPTTITTTTSDSASYVTCDETLHSDLDSLTMGLDNDDAFSIDHDYGVALDEDDDGGTPGCHTPTELEADLTIGDDDNEDANNNNNEHEYDHLVDDELSINPLSISDSLSYVTAASAPYSSDSPSLLNSLVNLSEPLCQPASTAIAASENYAGQNVIATMDENCNDVFGDDDLANEIDQTPLQPDHATTNISLLSNLSRSFVGEVDGSGENGVTTTGSGSCSASPLPPSDSSESSAADQQPQSNRSFLSGWCDKGSVRGHLADNDASDCGEVALQSLPRNGARTESGSPPPLDQNQQQSAAEVPDDMADDDAENVAEIKKKLTAIIRSRSAVATIGYDPTAPVQRRLAAGAKNGTASQHNSRDDDDSSPTSPFQRSRSHRSYKNSRFYRDSGASTGSSGSSESPTASTTIQSTIVRNGAVRRTTNVSLMLDSESSDAMLKKRATVDETSSGQGSPVTRLRLAVSGSADQKRENRVSSSSSMFSDVSSEFEVPSASSYAPHSPSSSDGENDGDDEVSKVDSRNERLTGVGGVGCDDKSSSSSSANGRRDSDADRRKAFLIATEVMTSERVFVDVLRLLTEDFKKAIEKAGELNSQAVIPPDIFSQILDGLPQLLSLNEDMLKDLEERINNWDENERISDILASKAPFLKMYASYIRNYPMLTNALEEARKKFPQFSQAVKDFETSERCKNLGIENYMLKPVQRIPQYRLLLQDYMKNISETSADYRDTQVALAIVSEVADHANETIRQTENFAAILQLQKRISGTYLIVKPGRRFIKEGELSKQCRKDRQPRVFLLFNDCLLHCSHTAQGLLKIHHDLPLTGMKVLPVMKTEEFKNEFNIISVARSFTLAANSQKERDEWINVLNVTIEDYVARKKTFIQAKVVQENAPDGCVESLGYKAPVWTPDARVTMCQNCAREFTLTFRRHHCRACGKVVCYMCSANRAPLRYLHWEGARVCDDCFRILHREIDERTSISSDTLDLDAITQDSRFENDDDGKKSSAIPSMRDIKAQFKKFSIGNSIDYKKNLSKVLQEVTANDEGSSISGHLHVRIKRQWKKQWFVIKDKVLYSYKASQDVAALSSTPLLGFEVKRFSTVQEGIEPQLYFQLQHDGYPSTHFFADSVDQAIRWVEAMRQASILE